MAKRWRAFSACLLAASGLVVLASTASASENSSSSSHRSHACVIQTPPIGLITMNVNEPPGNWLTAGVCISGRGPYQFLLDTGASATAVDPDLASRLKLPQDGPSQQFFGIGRSQTGRALKVRHWSLGSLALQPQTIYTLNTHLPSGISGILGADVLSRFGVIRLDYAQGQLVLAGPEGAPIAPGKVTGKAGQALPAAFAAYQPQGVLPITVVGFGNTSVATVAVDLGPKVVHLIVDSGAEVSTIDASASKGLGLRSQHATVEMVGIGGQERATVVRVRHWSLGLVPLVPESLVTLSLPTGSGTDVEGLFGADVLSQFQAITIDFKDGLLGVDQFPIV